MMPRYLKLLNRLPRREPIKNGEARDQQLGEHKTGWRVSVFWGGLLSVIVFILNICLLVWSLRAGSRRPNEEAGTATLYRGDCELAKRVFTWSHLVINIMSTLLLSASTVGIQLLSAPTRENIDRAHAVGKMAARWCGWISKLYLGRALEKSGLDSIDGQFIAITSDVQLCCVPEFAAYDYDVAFVPTNLFTGGLDDLDFKKIPYHNSELNLSYMKHIVAHPVILSPPECISTYDVDYLSTYRSVFVVMDYENASEPIISYKPVQGDAFDSARFWICSYINDPRREACFKNPQAVKDDWQLQFVNLDNSLKAPMSVKHCVVEQVSGQCRVVVSTILLAFVMVCTVVKITCLLYILLQSGKGFRPLVTVGDAIASFLTVEDPTTTGMGALSARDARKKTEALRWRNAVEYSLLTTDKIQRWESKRRFWFTSASPARWLICLFSCLSALTVTAFILRFFADSKGRTLTEYSYWQSYGFGLSLDSKNYIRASLGRGVIANSLLVNLPQFIVSTTYILYNSVITSMLLTAEYSSYAKTRRSLRVSERKGTQRSTYWLSLPFRYAIPLMIAAGILHWLISQGLYLIRIKYYTANDTEAVSRDAVSGCGWSPLAIFWACIVGVILSVALLVSGLRQFKPGMPIISSCSAAISAASHRNKEEGEFIVLDPLMYGVTGLNENGSKKVGFLPCRLHP